ncbi:hypothetical protein PS2_011877 [Malus domestica]
MVVCWKGCRTVQEDILELVDESERSKIDSKHLRELSFQVGSVYQFIDELLIQPDNEVSADVGYENVYTNSEVKIVLPKANWNFNFRNKRGYDLG